MTTFRDPYYYKRSDNGTYYTEGPGSLFMRFDAEAEAEHFTKCMNEAWTQGRKTGHMDRDIAQAVELERMKK